MAKESALSKNLKISDAQQRLILAVLSSSIVVGIAISLSLNFVSHISFNARVIMEKDQAINAYSSAISTIGICKKPKGQTYSEDELKNCDPSTIDIESIPNTLRYSIINGLAVNPELNSVSKSTVDLRCVNPLTSKNYTIKELNKIYLEADDVDSRENAAELLKVCSALRTIPDALPASDNQEAMLASLNMIFNLSGWQPEGLSPSNDEGGVETSSGAKAYGLGVTVDSDVNMAKLLLQNIERSIRSFDVQSASISLGDEDSLKLELGIQGYFTDKTELSEETKVIKPSAEKGKKK